MNSARFDWFLNLGISSTIHLLATSGGKKWRARPISSENKATIWELLLNLCCIHWTNYSPQCRWNRYSPPLWRIIVKYSQITPRPHQVQRCLPLCRSRCTLVASLATCRRQERLSWATKQKQPTWKSRDKRMHGTATRLTVPLLRPFLCCKPSPARPANRPVHGCCSATCKTKTTTKTQIITLECISKGGHLDIVKENAVPKPVNDSCSLKYLFWGHFPPGKHRIAYQMIEEVNTIEVYRFLASAFSGKFSFLFRRVRPLVGIFFPPPFFSQAKTSFPWKNYCHPLLAGLVSDSLLAGRVEQIYFPRSPLPALECRGKKTSNHDSVQT